MRLGMKSMLLMVVGYVVLIAAFAFGTDRFLRGFEEAMTRETASLIARETTALLSERSMSALAAPDGVSRALLRDRIQDLTLLSEAVSSISVVDREGRVVASDRAAPGTITLKPSVLFPDGGAARARRGELSRFFAGGEYAVDVPLFDAGALVGYVEVEILSRRLAGLFSAARRQLLIGAVAGLAGVVLLGGIFQFQISRRTASIAQTLEAAMETLPEAAPSLAPDEFDRAMRAAGRVRQALSAARRKSTRLEEGFSALAQAMRMGVILLRRDREPDFANPRALELFGSASLDDLKRRWPEVRAGLDDELSRVAAGDGPLPPLHVDLPGAGVAQLRVEIFRLGGDDCDEYLVLLNDPEIIDALETDVRLANQLQGVARVYRTVAHELRAPLSAMMIHLDLLRESLAQSAASVDTKAAQQRYVVVVRQELDRLNRSLSETLTQTIPPPGQQDRFDLREAIQELGTLLAPQARRQGVHFGLRMPETSVVLVGYRDRLKQSFLNIAVNALEAMPAGGRMSVEMDTLESGVRVRISDTGPGIPEDVLARIYERDFTTKGTGSGIGLYVARALVEMHGGEIHVDSAEQRGTVVEVHLPIVGRD
jgi:signal transduction histidine kinase